MAWYDDVWDYAKENALEIAKIRVGGAKAYIDCKDQKRRKVALKHLQRSKTWKCLVKRPSKGPKRENVSLKAPPKAKNVEMSR